MVNFYNDKVYIKMCEKAEDIQKLRNIKKEETRYSDGVTKHYSGFEMGDWFCVSNNKLNRKFIRIFTTKTSTKDLAGKPYLYRFVWLPRQDQLQDMCRKDHERRPNIKNIETWIDDFYLNYYHNWRKVFDSDKNENDPDISMESLWLIYVMEENFNKTWDNEREEWTKTK